MKITVKSPVRSRMVPSLLLSAGVLFLIEPACAQTAATTGQAPSAGGDASSAGSGNEGDIIVTARKREESLIQTPVAVSALNAEGLARYAATDLNRIADNMPSLQITRAATGTGALLAIRGVYTQQANPGFESSVSVAIDGVQLSRGYLVQTAFFDQQQVEVLKGPQALFFGKNSPAGVISLKSKGPTSTWEGSAKLGYEFNAKERYLEAAVGGPITPELGIRVALRASQMDGWLQNTSIPMAINPIDAANSPLPGATNNATTPAARAIAGRVTLQYEPSSDFTATLKVMYSNYHDNEISGLNQAVSCNGRDHPTSSGFQDPNADCIPDNRRSSGTYNSAILQNFPIVDEKRFYMQNNNLLASLNLNWKIGDNLNLSATSGGYNLDMSGFGTYDATTYNIFGSANFEKTNIFSQELRLTSSFDAPVNLMFGAYYEHMKMETGTISRGGFGFPVPVDPSFGNASVASVADNFTRGQTVSAFGQVLWDITHDLQFSGGVRYTKENRDADLGFTYINTLMAGTASLLPVGQRLKFPFRDSNFSPEATLTWHPTPEQTLYVSYKTGYKSGGFSTTSVILQSDTQSTLGFGSESAKGGEIGYKAQLFDRRLTFTSALYNYKFSNLQRSSFDVINNKFLVRNAAASRSRGAEFEASFRATDSLTLRGSAAFNKSYYLNYATATCYAGQTLAEGCFVVPGSTAKAQDLTGRVIALAPRFNGTAGFLYDMPLTSGLGLAITGDMRYVSSYRTQDDGVPGSQQAGYAKFNASIRLHEADDKWSFSVIGLNLANKYAILYTTSKPGGDAGDLYGPVERGREVRIEASYRF
ncbi:TonB-dependent receptor [Novosphingobium sp. BL-52-GroH]|uniref:TonB-dependent receptor n=1 Tax=Novosphingobium sp. BL-52-GroH TaxID=3349877 RepID=UPI00384DBF87